MLLSHVVIAILGIYFLSAILITIILPVFALSHKKNIEVYLKGLFLFLVIPFIVIIITYYLQKVYPNLVKNYSTISITTPNIVANYMNYVLYAIPLITLGSLFILNHFKKEVINKNALLFLKYDVYLSRIPLIIFVFSFYLSIFTPYIGDWFFSLIKIIMYLSVILYSIFALVRPFFLSNIYFIIGRLVQTLEQININQKKDTLARLFSKDFKVFLNTIDTMLPHNIKINDYDLKNKDNPNIKYILDSYLKLYILFGTKEQINYLIFSINKIKCLLEENDRGNILKIKLVLIDIYNELQEFLSVNKIKQSHTKKDSFYYYIKNGKYSEIINQSLAFLILLILYFLIRIMETLISNHLVSFGMLAGF